MNKKLTMMALGVIVGTTMLCGTAFAGSSGNMGYDAYKAAIKQTIAAKNVSPQVQVAVQDNGSLVVDMDAALKVDLENRLMSGVITDKTSNPQKTVNIYKQKEQAVIKSSDSEVYNVMKHDGYQELNDRDEQGDSRRSEMDSSRAQDAEKVIDALTGSIQNYIGLEKNQDGTWDVSFKMSESQMPAVVNALVPLAVRNASSEQVASREIKAPFVSDLQAKLPKLVDEIRLVNVDMTAKIGTDNLITKQIVNITVSGKDANGKVHELIVKFTIDFSDYNSTSPDTVELTGKQVQVQDVPAYGHRR